MRGLYLSHPSSHAHETGPHPESARRLRAVESALAAQDWLGLERIEGPTASRESLTAVHEETMLGEIEALAQSGGGAIDSDTIVSPASWEAALHAAGSACQAVDLLSEAGGGAPGHAFCGVRPPGHHAEGSRPMGFCLVNNVAIAARHAQAEHGASRVAVVDFDVHHGNGTQEIFYDDEGVLFVSIHQSPLWPGSGSTEEVGAAAGLGATVNLPVPPGSGGPTYAALFSLLVLPILSQWAPDLLLVSAGFDAHRSDPLAECLLDTEDFALIGAELRRASLELGAPLISCLEGGYSVDALSESVVAYLGAVIEPGSFVAPAPDPDLVARQIQAHGGRWSGLGG